MTSETGVGAGVDLELFELEARHESLCEELQRLERRLRELRLRGDVCPACGGSGRRWLRGGMYGEMQPQRCICQEKGPDSP